MTGLAHDTEVAQVFRFSPVALPLVTVLALVAGVLAGRFPARRAAAIDPAVVLRSL
jgi:ABC-type lipoprotein release transport system permease subunit